MRATAIDGDTLDLVCWRELGTTEAGIVEQALELNPGLADAGVTIAAGTALILPDAPAPAATPERELVQLWD
ncbi:MAG TPA: tail protein X [Croceibacterium sp.]|nr:tail protein X [Croceibacterium sp.]